MKEKSNNVNINYYKEKDNYFLINNNNINIKR